MTWFRMFHVGVLYIPFFYIPVCTGQKKLGTLYTTTGSLDWSATCYKATSKINSLSITIRFVLDISLKFQNIIREYNTLHVGAD